MIDITVDFLQWSINVLTEKLLVGNHSACLFEAVKLTENTDPDKYKYSDYSIEFDSYSFSSLPDNTMVRNIFGADMNSSVHIDNKEKDSW